MLEERGTGLVVSHQSNTVRVATDQGDLLCSIPRKLERPVCGDQVDWRRTGDQSGSIEKLYPRRNTLSRPHPRAGQRALAANLDHLLLVLSVKPEFQEALIDRYLVAAEYFGLPVSLLLNKIDLASPEILQQCRQRLQIYQDLGYSLHYSSVKQQHGLDELRRTLSEGRSMLVGQSGVGKSSLVRHLLPEHGPEPEVGAISEATGFGRHTTSSSTLYRLPDGGELLDSPGVRDFGLWHLPEHAIAPGFVEFRAFLGRCKFRNCQHDGEPGCAIRAGLECGDILPGRLASYFNIVKANRMQND